LHFHFSEYTRGADWRRPYGRGRCRHRDNSWGI